MVFKIFHSLVDNDLQNLFSLREDDRIRGHPLTIRHKFSRNIYRSNFFSVSVISIWNKLPQEVVAASSLTSFKSSLANYFSRNDIW